MVRPNSSTVHLEVCKSKPEPRALSGAFSRYIGIGWIKPIIKEENNYSDNQKEERKIPPHAFSLPGAHLVNYMYDEFYKASINTIK